MLDLLRAIRGRVRRARDYRRVMPLRDALRLALRFNWNEEIKINCGHPVILRGATTDIDCFDKIIMQRDYELPFVVDRMRLIVDAGANSGLASVYYARTFPQAKIIAIEPDKRNAELLRRNCRGLNVQVHEAALWPTKGHVQLVDPGNGAWSYSVRDGRKAEVIDDVQTITVEEILNDYGHIDILKLDIEGSERELMELSAHWLDKIGIIAVEFHDRFKPGCAQAFYGALHGRKFQQEVRGENIFVDLR